MHIPGQVKNAMVGLGRDFRSQSRIKWPLKKGRAAI